GIFEIHVRICMSLTRLAPDRESLFAEPPPASDRRQGDIASVEINRRFRNELRSKGEILGKCPIDREPFLR
ncbi:MAG: hypothetical protein OXN84_15365, partial [Albidovulum sp.]|nr:hypothetical protein [Albidovulum sp.]